MPSGIADCHIELLGGLHVHQQGRTITRFQTQKTAALLAYLAYHCHGRQASYPREQLVDLLWPEASPEAGRNRLSLALSSLRRQLEPPGVPPGAVIVADRISVGLNPRVVTTDVAEFEEGLKAAAQADSPGAQPLLQRAVDGYGGPLLPGYYEEWVLAEQQRLEGLFSSALHRLVSLLIDAGDLEPALHYASRGAALDPLNEEAHCDLMRIHAALGQPAAAARQYRELVQALERDLGETPSEAVDRLLHEIQQHPELFISPAGAPTPEPVRRGPSPPAPDVKSPSLSSFCTTDPPSVGTLAAGASVVTVEDMAPGGMPVDSRRGARESREGSSTLRLPLQLTRFVGREGELQQLQSLLQGVADRAGARLITLTGPGGNGKTRLAIELALLHAPRLKNRVWFVPLAEVTEPLLVLDSIAEALSIAPSADTGRLEQIARRLSPSPGSEDHEPALLILDNFEQLVHSGMGDTGGDGAAVVWRLLESVPALTILVTSRQLLGLSGEREMAVAPLPLPQVGDNPEQLLRASSVQLFVDRAQAVRPDFQLTPANASSVAELCQGLEGIPLAIELAAARAQVLTPGQMLSQLSHRLDFLVSRRRDMAHRHRTLRAAIDWSYQLLSPELQGLFARVSIFRGGWLAEAAEAVCCEPYESKPAVLDNLAQLRECSLVLTEESGPQMRFRMLETLREYGAARLSAEDHPSGCRRHAEYYLELAEEVQEKLWGPEHAAAIGRLRAEHDNLGAALAWAAENHTHLAVRLANTLAPFWETEGSLTEANQWLDRCLELGGEVDLGPRSDLFLAAGMLASHQGECTRARALLEESLSLANTLQDKERGARALLRLSEVAVALGDPERALALAEESILLSRESADARGTVLALCSAGRTACYQGESRRGRRLVEEGLQIGRRGTDRSVLAAALHTLADVAHLSGDRETARQCLEELLALQQEWGDDWGVVQTMGRWSEYLRSREYDEPLRSLIENRLARGRDRGDARTVAAALKELGSLALREGERETAGRC